jgi:DinB superfamily
MTEPQSPADLAAAIDAARDRMIGFADSCAASDWQAAPLPGDPRPVGVVVDHVAHAYEYLSGWLRDVQSGTRPAVSAGIVDELNAAHAAAGLCSQADAVAHLHRSGDAIVDLVAGLRPEDLDANGGQGRRLAQIAIRHADDHRSEIEAALAAAR